MIVVGTKINRIEEISGGGVEATFLIRQTKTNQRRTDFGFMKKNVVT